MSIGLVLSGGGARGAYEAGVLAGLHEVLGSAARPLFDIVTGTSVGAINAAHVAANAHRPDRGIAHLAELWTSLRTETHLRPQLSRLAGIGAHAQDVRYGRALLDPRPFEHLIGHQIPWDDLHDNVRRGVVGAVIVSALNVANGQTVSFVEMGPRRTYVPSADDARAARCVPLTADHVLASAAIPMLFPARRIEDSFFCDGGLRFNTPISPALRAGADRLLVIALRARRPATPEESVLEQYPNPVFLLGKVFDALLLDPIDHDLRVLERLNRLVDVLEHELPPAALGRIGRELEADRGMRYRRVRTLVFRPSEDIGVLALEHLRAHRATLCRSRNAGSVLLERLAALGAHVEADLLSYLLFDGAFARTLIALGRRDVHDRASEVKSFFASEAASAPVRVA